MTESSLPSTILTPLQAKAERLCVVIRSIETALAFYERLALTEDLFADSGIRDRHLRFGAIRDECVALVSEGLRAAFAKSLHLSKSHRGDAPAYAEFVATGLVGQAWPSRSPTPLDVDALADLLCLAARAPIAFSFGPGVMEALERSQSGL